MASTQQREQTGAFAILRVLRRRIGVLLLCAVLLPGAALAFSLAQEKEYTASASLLFRDPQFDQKLLGQGTVFAPNIDPAREAATNVRLVSLTVVAERTARKLNTGLTGSQVKSKVSVASEGQSDVVSISATDNRPELAARLANTFAAEYIAFRREADRSKIVEAQELVDQQLQRLTPEQQTGLQGRTLREQNEQLKLLASLQTGNAELVQPATVPTSPSSPKPVRNGVAGLALGLLLGGLLALLFERLDRRLKDPGEIAEAFDRPVLGAIPESRAIANADQDPHGLAPGEAEAFRMLRANLRYFNVDKPIDSVLITSSAPGDGKSTVAMHLGSASAGAGARVLLIEADLRHPTLAGRLRLPMDRGLSQLLAGSYQSIDEVIHSVRIEGERAGGRGLDVLVSGPIPPNPTDLIESERMREVIAAAQAEYDLVIIDTPPTSVVSDAIPLVKEVSGVIVVCRLGKTTRESASHLRGQLMNLEANLLGVVVNSVGRQSTYYGYGYGYGYGETPQKRRKRGGRPRPRPEHRPDAREHGEGESIEVNVTRHEPAGAGRANGNGGSPDSPDRAPAGSDVPDHADAQRAQRPGFRALQRRLGVRRTPPRGDS